jgi:aromatic-L-amino-acid/L-tryptophan decarboxylase
MHPTAPESTSSVVSPRSALDPGPAEARAMFAAVEALVLEQLDSMHERDVLGHPRGTDLADRLLAARPGAGPGDIEVALTTVRALLDTGVDNAAAGELAFIPGSGLFTAALGELMASVANRYTGLAGLTPAAVALEQGVLTWLTELFSLPERSQGLLLSGGSNANLTALVTAREKLAPEGVDTACLYVGDHAHASVRKAARIAGFRGGHVRVCGSIDGLRLDPEAVRVAVKQDLADGLQPVAIVGAAGTTNTGAIDPLDELADLAADLGLWFHVDAAYGGFFQLTTRGRARLHGIERADSITLDPHKSLFLPYGLGALLVRDRADLAHAFAEDADYLRDHDADGVLPDFGSISPELTREWRGLKLWLPLQLHGTDAFATALDGALDLANHAYDALATEPLIELGPRPDLSVITFRVDGDDEVQDAVLAAVNADGRVHLSSTRLDGRVVMRLAVLSHRTTRATVDRAVELIRAAARDSVG